MHQNRFAMFIVLTNKSYKTKTAVFLFGIIISYDFFKNTKKKLRES